MPVGDSSKKSTGRSTRLNRVGPYVILACASVIFFSRALFTDNAFYAFDAIKQYLPWAPIETDHHVRNPLITDPINQIYYSAVLFKKALTEHRLQLWDPLLFSGGKIPPGSLTRHFSPIVIFCYLFLDPLQAHDWILFLHILGSGLWLYGYLRTLQLDRWPALLGGLSWMFNGYVMVWLEFELVPILAFALPLVLYRFEAWMAGPTRLNSLILAVACAFTFTSGYAHLIMYQSIFLTAYVVFRLALTTGGRSFVQSLSGAQLAWTLGFLCLSACTAAIFLVGHMQMLDGSHRTPFTFSELYRYTGRLPVQSLWTLISPDLFGNPVHHAAFTPRPDGPMPYNNYNELCIYMGGLPLLFALIGSKGAATDSTCRFYLLSSLAVLAMAMGSVIYYPLFRWAPGLSFSTPTRILYLFGFCGAVLAAFGAQQVIRPGRRPKAVNMAIGSVLLILACFLGIFLKTAPGIDWLAGLAFKKPGDNSLNQLMNYFTTTPVVLLRPIIIFTAALLVLNRLSSDISYKRKHLNYFFAALLIAVDLISFGRTYNPVNDSRQAFPKTGAIHYLTQDTGIYRIVWLGKFFHNSFGFYGIEDIAGYSSFYSRRYGDFLHLAQDGADVPKPGRYSRWIVIRGIGSPLLDSLNTKYLLTPKQVVLTSKHFPLVYDGEIKIYQNLRADPRCFVVHDAQIVHDRDEAYAALSRSTREDLHRRVILESAPVERKTISSPSPMNPAMNLNDKARVGMVSYGPGKIELKVESPQSGFLVLSENYARDWKATLQGRAAPIFRANYMMMAVPVPAGQSHIVFYYHPSTLRLSIMISLGSWLGLGAIAVYLLFGKVGRHETAQ